MPDRDRRKRSRSRGRRKDCDGEQVAEEDFYSIEILTGRHQDAMSIHDVAVPVDDDAEAPPQVLPHVCARLGGGYAIRISNRSRKHVACAVKVDGENALLKEGSLIVAPGDKRELPGFLVSKNFVGREYVKEYRDFRFGKPKVVETSGSSSSRSNPKPEQVYKTYGLVTCDVYEAVLDEEVDSDQELRGQSTHYRGSGLNGGNEEREVPEGKKSHLLYSSVTVQGPRSTIANSTRGRWWIRGKRLLRNLEIRYREAHSLMLLGVDPAALGLISYCKDEEDLPEKLGCRKKEDGLKEKYEKEEDDESKVPSGIVEMCDLTAEGDEGGAWSKMEAPPQAAPVDLH